jgi:hypothetical protein
MHEARESLLKASELARNSGNDALYDSAAQAAMRLPPG